MSSLVSYHYAKTWPINEFHSEGLRLIADSGAFSAESKGASIDIAAFADWATQWLDSFAWIASLDVIGDASGSWDNYTTLREQHNLNVVPTVHYGSKPESIDRYANDGVDFIGLGGMVSRKSSPDQLLRWCLSMFRYAQENYPEVRFHGWGVTHQTLLSLPWYSVDSSGFGSAYMFARALLVDPTTNKSLTYPLNGRDAYKHADLLLVHYGVRPQEASVSTPQNALFWARMMAKSAQHMENASRRKHKVTPPKYGEMQPANGTHIHYATGSRFVIESLGKSKEGSLVNI